MKRIGASAALLFLLAVFGLWSFFRTEHTIETALETLDKAQTAAERGEDERVKSLCGELEEQWSDFRRLPILLTDSEHALEITMSVSRIKGAQDEELKSELFVLRGLLEAYLYEQTPTILNIL